MEFRPCIDIHNGKVKQIVGSSLADDGDMAEENFVSEKDAAFFARFYEDAGLYRGHVIMLNSKSSEYYEEDKRQAVNALHAFPDGLQIGGGITAEDAAFYIKEGASHVIVTSYVFSDGHINYEHLQKLKDAVGKEHIVLDMSCKKSDDDYFVVTDRWQKLTDEKVTPKLFEKLSDYCDEFLIHAAHVEGTSSGIDEELIDILNDFDQLPITYAGGVHEYDDIMRIRELGKGNINVTVGSALDIFGGPLNFETILRLVEDV